MIGDRCLIVESRLMGHDWCHEQAAMSSSPSGLLFPFASGSRRGSKDHWVRWGFSKTFRTKGSLELARNMESTRISSSKGWKPAVDELMRMKMHVWAKRVLFQIPYFSQAAPELRTFCVFFFGSVSSLTPKKKWTYSAEKAFLEYFFSKKEMNR